jgi:tetratricopeptide (TPR) repeat protein
MRAPSVNRAMHRISCLLVLVACTSTEASVSPPVPTPMPATSPAPSEVAPSDDAPTETTVATLDAPRPGPSNDPKCAEAFALHASASEAMAAGQTELARGKWLQVMRDFPTCPEVPHAFLALGENFFAKGDMAGAKSFYEKVALLGDPELRAYARYKQAWCELNLGDAAAALEGFIAAAQQAGKGELPPRLARLRDVALRDSVIAYAQIGKPAKAAEFYRRMAGEAGAERLLARLAQLYREREDMEAAAIVCIGVASCTSGNEVAPSRVP